MPTKLIPALSRILLDNNRVRVFEFTAKPGERTGMHFRPESVIYFLTDTKFRITDGSGNNEDIEFNAGSADFRKAQLNDFENIGSEESHTLFVELKGYER
jgi:hypothetical protein